MEIPLSFSTILNNEKDDKYCFLWSISAHPHPCHINHLNRKSNWRQNFDELLIDGFDLTNGFNCSEV